MPFVEITLIEGRTPEQKKALFQAITAAVVEHAAVQPDAVRVVLREVPAAHWAVAGVPKG